GYGVEDEPTALVRDGRLGAELGDADLDRVLAGWYEPAVDPVALADPGEVDHHRQVGHRERDLAGIAAADTDEFVGAFPARDLHVLPAGDLAFEVLEGDGELDAVDQTGRWRVELVDHPVELGEQSLVVGLR